MQHRQQHESDKNMEHMDMGKRGVTRPSHDHSQMQHHHNNEQDGDSMNMQHQHMSMSHEERMHMMQMHHAQTLWIYWTIVLLGCWLILSPLTFSYAKGIIEPAGGRPIWLSLTDRIAVMKWSDIISGVLLVIFGYRSLKPNRPISLWICCFVGVWLSIAPLLFWSPSAAAYITDTFAGMWVLSLSVLIPGMPNMIMYMKMGNEVPEGWSYNPSSWAQRWIMIVLGFLGFVVSRYLAAFQLGYIDTVWDPFFGSSSEQVLTSHMSQSLFISDAGLGSLAYTFEFLMGFMGSTSRWRTMPWMVAMFGILVIPLGLVHIILVISQPLIVGAWCTFCLVAACIMLPMLPLEVDEVIAMIQHTVQSVRKGEKFWTVFWKGGQSAGMQKDERTPPIAELNDHFGKVIKASVWGMSKPLTLVLATLIGIFLVVLPGITSLPIQSTLADVNHLCGALIVVVSVICMGEVVRAGRYLNVLLGLAVAITPWFVQDSENMVKIIDVIAGLVVVALSIPRGKITEQYGWWNKYVV